MQTKEAQPTRDERVSIPFAAAATSRYTIMSDNKATQGTPEASNCVPRICVLVERWKRRIIANLCVVERRIYALEWKKSSKKENAFADRNLS